VAQVQEDIWVEGVSLGSLGRRKEEREKVGKRREQERAGQTRNLGLHHT